MTLVIHTRYSGPHWVQSLFLLAAIFSSPLSTHASTQLHKLDPAFPNNGSLPFGTSVALDENTAVIGDPDSHNTDNQPVAYVFDVATGQRTNVLTRSGQYFDDGFGWSVAVENQVAAIAAPFRNASKGAVDVFDTATGIELFKLESPSPAQYGQFGYSVAIGNNKVLVGEPSLSVGQAFIFDLTNGQLLNQLSPTGTYSSIARMFGSTVAIGDNIAAIATSGSRRLNQSVYTFDFTTGQQRNVFFASDGHDDDEFGAAIAIGNERLIVGAPGTDSPPYYYSGAAYVFDVTTGQQLFKLTAPDIGFGGRFGASVAISGNLAMVGAPGDWGSDFHHGAYLFDLTTGQFLTKITEVPVGNSSHFGSSVALQGNIALIGAKYSRGTYVGAAYVFDIVPEPTSCGLMTMALLTSASITRFRRRDALLSHTSPAAAPPPALHS